LHSSLCCSCIVGIVVAGMYGAEAAVSVVHGAAERTSCRMPLDTRVWLSPSISHVCSSCIPVLVYEPYSSPTALPAH
jgi:hypothetical protein